MTDEKKNMESNFSVHTPQMHIFNKIGNLTICIIYIQIHLFY